MTRIGSWLSGALDPVRFADSVSVDADPWQAKVLRSTAPRLHLNCSRQVGKSTTTSLVGLHRALYVPGSVVLIVSPTDRQSGELFRKIQGFYAAIGKPVEATGENMRTLTLENHSRILSLPASEGGIRGFTADLILVDEASRVPDSLYESISPMLAVSGGRLIAMSTPAGRRGWWYEATLSERWELVEIPATECPRISAEFLAEERERLAESVFAQEYLCQFVDASGAAFNGADVSAIFDGEGPLASVAPFGMDRGARETSELLGAHHRRIVAARNGPERRRESERRRCEHRWRQGTPNTCVWCGAEKC